jgi:hypothetical protein
MAGKALTFFEMWGLVLQNYNSNLCPDDAFRQLVTPELLMALFWEETQFQNRRQIDFDHNDWLKRWTMPVEAKHNPNGNHAVGFGQAERESIITVKALRPHRLAGLIPDTDPQAIDVKTVDGVILADDNKAVQIAWRLLWSLFDGTKNPTTESLVKAFAGPPNEPKVPGILHCARVLQGFQAMPPITVEVNSMYPNLLLVAGAFWNARKNGDFQRAFGVNPEQAKETGEELRKITGANFIPALHDYVTKVATKYKTA